jgi:hypothetical protein
VRQIELLSIELVEKLTKQLVLSCISFQVLTAVVTHMMVFWLRDISSHSGVVEDSGLVRYDMVSPDDS